tara:strand:- start:706 stop:867 length:162 start_codon:yes stop_codon:yes gene_type:complete
MKKKIKKIIISKALNYNEWMSYVEKEHKKAKKKNTLYKNQRPQVKESPLNFNW